MKMQSELQEWDDGALVRRAISRGASDDRPFTLLFDRHKQLVWQICYRFSGDPADAEDLLQEVFIKAYRSLSTFQGRSSFRTWLYQVAVNTCRNELRHRKRRPVLVEEHIDDLMLVDADAPRDLLGQDFAALSSALLHLKPEEREILILRDIEELPYAEIAAVLGIQLSAAKMRLQRARLALRSRITAERAAEDQG